MDYQLSYACLSHIGLRRRMNQDNFICNKIYAEPESDLYEGKLLTGTLFMPFDSLFGVFDGMGGEERGEMASYLAAKAALRVSHGGTPRQILETICQSANQAICSFTEQNRLETCGTTAAILLFSPDRIMAGNVGDSKIFRLTGQKFIQISEDHLSIGLPGQKPPLGQYLGIPPEEMLLSPYYVELPYQDSDRYLICSDGLTDMVSQEEIIQVLMSLPIRDATQALLQSALEHGGKDNITLIILEIQKAAGPGILGKIRNLFGFQRK